MTGDLFMTGRNFDLLYTNCKWDPEPLRYYRNPWMGSRMVEVGRRVLDY